MYEHYKPAQDIFVNREEYLRWMEDALERCKDKSVVLHLRGIGGIGKSTLLNHWTRTIDSTVRLDCQQYTEFYSRLDILAKGAVRVGVDLKRFDILWHIRKRFVEGVEPATEKGRDWAKEVLGAIPFIGSLASIGSAIKSVGDSVAPKIRQRYGDVGQWLQDRLGKQYIERLLEILWKEPEHAEFLYLDALLEDINNRKRIEEPLLFLFDHSENVDCDDRRWIYAGKKIAEMELWYVFVSSLKNCVGVIASRRGAPSLTDKTLNIEERELMELDRPSSRDLLLQRGVTDGNFQDKIVSISAGNPFVINTICDMLESEDLSLEEIESLRANTLDDVRLKTWRRLFSQTKDLLDLVDRAGVLPSFHKELMTIVSPNMKTDQWERLIRLSFVKPRSNGSFVLHDLARDLVRAELADRIGPVTTEVSKLLAGASEREKKPALLGFALSVKALESEEEAIAELETLVELLLQKGFYADALEIVENTDFQTYVGDIKVLGSRGIICVHLNRFSESEFTLNAAISSLEELDSEQHKRSIGIFLYNLGWLLQKSGRYAEAEEPYLKSLEILRKVAESKEEDDLYELSCCLRSFAFYFYRASRASEGFDFAMEALEIARSLENPWLLPLSLNMAAIVMGNAGRFEEQKELYQEAIDFQRNSIEQSPDAPFEKAHLASLLSNVSLSMYNTEEIEEIHKEIFQLREELSDIYPVGLAFQKIIYGWHCLKHYRMIDAEKFLKEALDFYTDSTKLEPKQWLYYIEWCQFALAELYTFDGRLSLGRELIDEMYPTDLSDLNTKSSAFLLDIFSKITLSGFHYFMTNQFSKALNDFEIALEILDKMTIDTSEEVLAVFWCLASYVLVCDALGRNQDAKDAVEKAKDALINHGASWWVKLGSAGVDCNLARILLLESDFVKAEEISERVLGDIDKFVDGMPEVILPRKTKVLNNLSIILSRQGRNEEALQVLQDAIAMKEEVAEKSLGIFQASKAISFNNLGALLFRMGQNEEARNKVEESLQIFRELMKSVPEKYGLGLASALHNLAIISYANDNASQAKKYYEEASKLRKQVKDQGSKSVSDLLELEYEEVVQKQIWSEETEPIIFMF